MLDGKAVIDLMIEHRIGVTTKPLDVPEIDEDFFAKGFDEE